MLLLPVLVVLAVLALGPAPSIAGERRVEFPVEQLREDFALARSAITKAHAGLYVYQSHQAVEKIFDQALATLRDTTEVGFYGVVAGTLAQIHDGHTRSLPSEAWMAWYSDSAHVLPLRVKVTTDRAWVVASADPRVARGVEILAVEGRPIRRIIDDIGRRLPADGYIQTRKAAQISERFELFFYLFESQPDSFKVDVRAANGDRATVWVAAVSPSALPPAANQATPLALSFLQDSTVALLRISTFAADEITDAGLHYAEFLDDAFTRIGSAHSTDLILDLRGNDGGRDVYGSMLMSHLVNRPFAYYRSLEARTDRVDFWRHTNADSTFNAQFGRGLIRTAGGTYRLPKSRHQNLRIQQPKEPGFRGRVWVLTDGGTFSTTAEFCSVAKSLGRATFLGEETGGTYEGNTSGTFVILTLPHTGVRIVVPLVRYRLAVKSPKVVGRGVIPDEAIENGRPGNEDAVVARALALIGKARR